MKVTEAALPFLPLCRRLLPARLADLSLTLLKATALELAILAGHLLLYPAGIIQERRGTSRPALPARVDWAGAGLLILTAAGLLLTIQSATLHFPPLPTLGLVTGTCALAILLNRQIVTS